MKLVLAAFVAIAVLAASPAPAQTPYRASTATNDQNPQPQKAMCWDAAAVTYRACSALTRESFRLVASNAPAAPVSVYGGDYILSQRCTSYGTLTLQGLAPDGTTWLPLLTRTASDTAGGTGLALGSYASVRITVTGTAGCDAILARVPA